MPGAPPSSTDDLSTAELLGRLTSEVSVLVRQELELAKAEVAAHARHVGFGLGGVGVAGLLALGALGAAIAASIGALALVLPLWAAALIVAAACGIGAGTAGLMGARQLQMGARAVPEKTIETLKEDVDWAKGQVRSASR